MKSRERARVVLSVKNTNRYPTGPLAVHYCAVISSSSLNQFTLRPQNIAESGIRYYDYFKPDTVWVSGDTSVTAQAMAAEVMFCDVNQLIKGTGRQRIKTDFFPDKIPLNEISCGDRFRIRGEALSLAKNKIWHESFVVGCFDQWQFSLVCALIGMERIIIRLLSGPAVVSSLMAIAAEQCIAFGKLLAESGSDIVEIDSIVPSDLSCRYVPAEIALWGNLNPLDFIFPGNTDYLSRLSNVIRTDLSKYKRNRFVLS